MNAHHCAPENVQKMGCRHDTHAILSQSSDKDLVAQQIIVVCNEVVCLASNGNFTQDVVIGITTPFADARRLDTPSTSAQKFQQPVDFASHDAVFLAYLGTRQNLTQFGD